MRLTFRILSALLRYPNEDVQAAAPELAKALSEDGLLSNAQIASLEPMLATLAKDDLIDLQEAYVSLFDRGRAQSLHLFEHVHGESRDRGQAMVDLRDRYEANGLEISARELPDYLPLYLEYLSVLPPEEAMEQLAQPGLVIAALAERLQEKNSLYAAPMAVLRELAAIEADIFASGAPDIAPPDNPDDLAELDAAWEEEQIRFDAPAAPLAPGGEAPCPQVADMIARFHDPDLVKPELARRPHDG